MHLTTCGQSFDVSALESFYFLDRLAMGSSQSVFSEQELDDYQVKTEIERQTKMEILFISCASRPLSKTLGLILSFSLVPYHTLSPNGM